MEQKTLQLIARLQRLAGRQGRPFDVLKFSEDASYAQSTLAHLMESRDEEILVTGHSLLQAMASLPNAASTREVVVNPTRTSKPAGQRATGKGN